MILAFTVTQSARADLLVHYQFESTEGVAPLATTPDASGNFVSSSTAPLVNALVGFGTNTPGTDYPQLVAGPAQSLNPGGAMQFYGGLGTSFTRVEIADASAAALDAPFTNFTFAAWVNPSSLTNDRFIAGKIGGSGQRGWQFYSGTGTTNLTLDYFESTANGTERSFTLTDALPLDTWTHVAFTFDGTLGTEAMYVNGVAQSITNTGILTSTPATLNAANTAAFRVGHRGATGSAVGGWSGSLDDVRVYSNTLTAGEISALIQTNVPIPGDVNNDMLVNIFDINLVSAHWGETGPVGDANHDMAVNIFDVNLISANWSSSPGGATAVPEPSSIFLAGLGLLGMCLVMFRRRQAGR